MYASDSILIPFCLHLFDVCFMFVFKASEEMRQLSSSQQPPLPPQKYGSSSAYRIPVQPDVFISADDFGVAPELLTTAQKVAILESQAFQNKNFKPVLPPTAALPLPQPYFRSNSSSLEQQQQQQQPQQQPQPYVPTGLRMKTETLDAVAQDITLDGGPVAKTTDKLSTKITNWEGWVKEINKSTPGPSTPTKR